MVESITIDGKRSSVKPKKLWEEKLGIDISELHQSENMTMDKAN